MAAGPSTTHALGSLESRGVLFIGPQEEVRDSTAPADRPIAQAGAACLGRQALFGRTAGSPCD
jgi:hypothetical protein